MTSTDLEDIDEEGVERMSLDLNKIEKDVKKLALPSYVIDIRNLIFEVKKLRKAVARSDELLARVKELEAENARFRQAETDNIALEALASFLVSSHEWEK